MAEECLQREVFYIQQQKRLAILILGRTRIQQKFSSKAIKLLELHIQKEVVEEKHERFEQQKKSSCVAER